MNEPIMSQIQFMPAEFKAEEDSECLVSISFVLLHMILPRLSPSKLYLPIQMTSTLLIQMTSTLLRGQVFLWCLYVCQFVCEKAYWSNAMIVKKSSLSLRMLLTIQVTALLYALQVPLFCIHSCHIQ